MKPYVTWKGIVVSCLPSVVLLGLFYSLAIHMHRTLGRWPNSIGTDGFPPALELHATVTCGFFGFMLLSLFSAVPVVLVMGSVLPRCKAFPGYCAVHVGGVLVAWMLMQCAPEPFLYWWRD